jgi:hypothetical protein
MKDRAGRQSAEYLAKAYAEEDLIATNLKVPRKQKAATAVKAPVIATP